MDLDNFKQVNDTFGHPAGDQAIRKTGQILSGIFRASDIVGRLGGDEFAAFLCGRVTDEMVRQRAADICAQLHIVLGDREIIHLTASVGVYLAGRGQEFEGTVPRRLTLRSTRPKRPASTGFASKAGRDTRSRVGRRSGR